MHILTIYIYSDRNSIGVSATVYIQFHCEWFFTAITDLDPSAMWTGPPVWRLTVTMITF